MYYNKENFNKLKQLIYSSKKGILIVDDIVDTGNRFFDIKLQIDVICNFVALKLPVYFYSLIKRASVQLDFNIYSSVQLDNIDVISFPWNSYESNKR
jgi:hypoxanthine phosphoribosyltransferase